MLRLSLKYSGLWRFRIVDFLVCGRFGLWPFLSVFISVYGRSGLWPLRFVAFPVCGHFGLWSFRFVAVMTCYHQGCSKAFSINVFTQFCCQTGMMFVDVNSKCWWHDRCSIEHMLGKILMACVNAFGLLGIFCWECVQDVISSLD